MICWACDRAHTGSVWCPHCSAPVDPGSAEARRSPYWAVDPRNPLATPPEPDPWIKALEAARAAGDLDECLRLRRADANLHRIPVDQAVGEERYWHSLNSTAP